MPPGAAFFAISVTVHAIRIRETAFSTHRNVRHPASPGELAWVRRHDRRPGMTENKERDGDILRYHFMEH